MKIFKKSLYEYLSPVWYYVIACVVIVIFQYEGMLANIGYDPMVARITQWLWMLFVAAATIKLIYKKNFGPKQIIFTGILFSIIIHGLKAFIFRVFVFPYPAESWPWLHIYKFLYGSALVMAIVVGLGLTFWYLKKNKAKLF